MKILKQLKIYKTIIKNTIISGKKHQERGLNWKSLRDEQGYFIKKRNNQINSNLIRIRVFPVRIEAEHVINILNEHGIEALIRADDAGGYRPHLSMTGAGASVLVTEENAERALEILKKYESDDVIEK